MDRLAEAAGLVTRLLSSPHADDDLLDRIAVLLAHGDGTRTDGLRAALDATRSMLADPATDVEALPARIGTRLARLTADSPPTAADLHALESLAGSPANGSGRIGVHRSPADEPPPRAEEFGPGSQPPASFLADTDLFARTDFFADTSNTGDADADGPPANAPVTGQPAQSGPPGPYLTDSGWPPTPAGPPPAQPPPAGPLAPPPVWPALPSAGAPPGEAPPPWYAGTPYEPRQPAYDDPVQPYPQLPQPGRVGRAPGPYLDEGGWTRIAGGPVSPLPRREGWLRRLWHSLRGGNRRRQRPEDFIDPPGRHST
jgi:hypothetical protein